MIKQIKVWVAECDGKKKHKNGPKYLEWHNGDHHFYYKQSIEAWGENRGWKITKDKVLCEDCK